jgi:hypothetical protein
VLGEFTLRIRMKPDLHHPRRKSFARTSSQGIV